MKIFRNINGDKKGRESWPSSSSMDHLTDVSLLPGPAPGPMPVLLEPAPVPIPPEPEPESEVPISDPEVPEPALIEPAKENGHAQRDIFPDFYRRFVYACISPFPSQVSYRRSAAGLFNKGIYDMAWL